MSISEIMRSSLELVVLILKIRAFEIQFSDYRVIKRKHGIRRGEDTVTASWRSERSERR